MKHGIVEWTEKVYTDVEIFYHRSVEFNFCLFAFLGLTFFQRFSSCRPSVTLGPWTGCEAGISSTKPSTPSPNKVTYHTLHVTHYTLHLYVISYMTEMVRWYVRVAEDECCWLVCWLICWLIAKDVNEYLNDLYVYMNEEVRMYSM